MKIKMYFFYILIIISTGCYSWNSISDGVEMQNNGEESGNENYTDEEYVNESFRDDFNGTAVDSSVWQVATWSEHNGQTSAERCYVKDGYLTLLFINNDGVYLSSAIQTRKEFLYGKWEARLKVSNVPGLLNSMYTIDWDDTSNSSSASDGTKQEIDIEFLTNTFSGSTGEVHAAVHAAGKSSSSGDYNLSFNPSSGFHTWGLEITPDYIQWSVDGTVLVTYTYSQYGIYITAPYQLKFNVWTQADWIGGPPESGVTCTYLIDWIQFTPYSRK